MDLEYTVSKIEKIQCGSYSITYQRDWILAKYLKVNSKLQPNNKKILPIKHLLGKNFLNLEAREEISKEGVYRFKGIKSVSFYM